MSTKATYAVASDYSEVIKTDDGFGAFATEIEALDRQIMMLEARRGEVARYLARARRRRRQLQAKAGRG